MAARVLGVWSRFAELYPESVCGVFVDPIEGPVWVDHRARTTVRVVARSEGIDWSGEAHHIRIAGGAEQTTLDLV